MFKNPWEFTSQEECDAYVWPEAFPALDSGYLDGPYCNATFDSLMCWPATPAGTVKYLPCPQTFKGIVPGAEAFRKCASNGMWLGNDGNVSARGWTNYTACLTKELRDLMKSFYSGSKEDRDIKGKIAETTRIMEMIGLIMSLVAILMSIGIFSYFRNLRNRRTLLHINLFVAMVVQIISRLILYADQYVTRGEGARSIRPGIDNMLYVCESFYILLEYGRTAMFMWMLLEGIHIHNKVVMSVFKGDPQFKWYYLCGWGAPVVLTIIWAIVTGHYSQTQCWFGYNLTPYYWILEGPRLTIIFINVLFLLNIIRVLVTKLRSSSSSDTKQARKAVKGAIVLLPLLGVTNFIRMLHAPVGRVWEFALWSYSTHFLSTFQGMFVALWYCLFNKEVRRTIYKKFQDRELRRHPEGPRRFSTLRAHANNNHSSHREEMSLITRSPAETCAGNPPPEKEFA